MPRFFVNDTEEFGKTAVIRGREKAISYFSYQNDSVYITAPGQGLHGLGIASGTTYVTGQGTSYAAPMVSAAAALALSVRPELTPAEFRDLLRDTAEDLGEAGWDTVYGHFLPFCLSRK